MNKKLNRVILCIAVLFLGAEAYSEPVPDTGQTKCYDDLGKVISCPNPGERFYGQVLIINPMSYTRLDSSGNALLEADSDWSMVKDNVTGLVWEVKTNQDGKTDYDNPHDADNTYSWEDSSTFINSLNNAVFGGYDDWRLPTIKELGSIIKYDIPNPGPTIDGDFFPNTISGIYWSSTGYARINASAWGVNFYYGYTDYPDKASLHFVRAVHGEQSPSVYKDNGDGTITESSTGLMWQKDSALDTMTWEEALAYADESELAGFTDWRLPTQKELRSLLDYSRYQPAIDSVFTNTSTSAYWSSTTDAYTNNAAWVEKFYDGFDYRSLKYVENHVRIVRGGQVGDGFFLSVTPTHLDVQKQKGTAAFNVSNTGSGEMHWTASVISGASWLQIQSGASGTDSGIITCAFDHNKNKTTRTATVRITADGVNDSSVDVTLTQDGQRKIIQILRSIFNKNRE